MRELIGTTISHYTIQSRLARGGMSEVYLARDNETEQIVAVKLVHKSAGEYCERFCREVRTVARLRHAHILPALDYGEYDDWHYLVTPYIAYGTLHSHLARGPVSLDEAGNILEQLAGALQYAHEQGIVHRDIKPSNILLQDGKHVYLADFGLVKEAGESHSLTRSNFVIGTPEYMAPELVESQVTAASDIYALGILLYQMLTGRVPFNGSTPLAIVWKHLQDPPPPPSSLNPAIPFAVERVILRALAKSPTGRFRTAQQMAYAYRQALDFEQASLSLTPTLSADVRVFSLPQIDIMPDIPVNKYKQRKQQIFKLVAMTIMLATFLAGSVLLAFTTSAPFPTSDASQPTLQGASISGGMAQTPIAGSSPTPSLPTATAPTTSGGKGDNSFMQPFSTPPNVRSQLNETGEGNNTVYSNSYNGSDNSYNSYNDNQHYDQRVKKKFHQSGDGQSNKQDGSNQKQGGCQNSGYGGEDHQGQGEEH
ncbi:MAG: serine/threonine protein kinase [Ktedonobacteraceae bacterium]|nr:serine/threonine protein kinase [Ktedonobacteraceae bacterium]